MTSCEDGKKNDAAVVSKRPNLVNADVFIVSAQNFTESYTASGTLLPNEELEIRPEVSGRVTAISFTEGAPVRKGQTLIQLDNADLQAQVRKLKVQRALQKTTASRQDELVKIGGIARQDLDATNTTIQGIDADLAGIEAQLRKLRIVAPFDGIAGLRQISPGAIVTPSTIITTLQQVQPLKLDFSIPEQYRDKLKQGSKISFTVKGSLDTNEAIILATDPAANPMTHTLTLRAKVPNADRKLTAGAFAHVYLPFGSNSNALMIPAQAIIPTTRDKQVAILNGGKVEMKTVITGVRTADKIEILQGISTGDTVITTGLMQVSPEKGIKIRKVER